MWDLETIVRNNNQAALDTIMEGTLIENAQQPAPEVWPLSILVDKMHAGPPSLDSLMAIFTNTQGLETFLGLIQDFLPEHKTEIMAEPSHRRVYKFCHLFSSRYYPMPRAIYDASVFEFVEGIPVWLMGLSYTAYHELDMRPGYLLLLSLVIYPFEGDFRDEEDDDVPFDPMPSSCRSYNPRASDIQWVRNLVKSLAIGGEWIAPMGFSMVKVGENAIELKQAVDTEAVQDAVRETLEICRIAGIKTQFTRSGKTAEQKINGARIPLVDMVQKIVGHDLAVLIPGPGWTPEVLHYYTDSSKYEGVGDFATWACSETGTVLLDSNYEDCSYIEGTMDPVFKWTRSNVDILTTQWPKVKEIRKKIDHIVEWLEKDPRNNFRELLEFLLDRPELKVKIRPPRNTTEHYLSMPLDMLTDEELEEREHEQSDDDGES